MPRASVLLRLMRLTTAAAVALLHAGCAAVPDSRHPHPHPAGAAGTAAVSRAAEAWARWSGRPDDPEARRRLDGGLRRLVKWVDSVPADRRETAFQAAGLVVESDPLEEPGVNRFTPADEVDQSVLLHCHRREGAGLPVVAWRANDGSGRWDSLRPPEGLFTPATAVLDRLPDGRTRLRFLSPVSRAEVELGGKTHPLAADFSAPVATLASHAAALRRSAFSGMLDSGKSVRREKLYLIQPYDPERIPLLMVHGLKSTPVAFANLVNDLLADPEIRRRYQIWHYHYPTGTPVLMNAMTLRRVLRETLRKLDPKGRDSATDHMVVIGHSMGGVISHTLASDSGWSLWDSAVAKRPGQLAGPPESLAVLRDLYTFRANPAVRRVIFVAAPHRGSLWADNWLGSLGQRLLKPDPAVIRALRPAVEPNRALITPFLTRLIDEGKVSSIRTLSGQSPALMALARIPPAVPFHSIIGQKRPGPVEKGSDGFVTYASSHLDGAESELVVPYGHNAHLHPWAVAEIRRILLRHLQSGSGKG